MNKWKIIRILGLVILIVLIGYLFYLGFGKKTVVQDVVFLPDREVVEVADKKDVAVVEETLVIKENGTKKPVEKKKQTAVKKMKKVGKETKAKVEKDEMKKEMGKESEKLEVKEKTGAGEKTDPEKKETINAAAVLKKKAAKYYPFVFHCADEDCKKIEKINLNFKEAK